MSNKNLTENFGDLPKWAQSEVKTLQMRLKESKKELQRMTDNPVSNTILGSNYEFQGEPIKYLNNNQRITFVLPTGDIQAVVTGDYLQIHAVPSDYNLFVKPEVSNVIQIHLK